MGRKKKSRHHKKIAQNRGPEWRQNLVNGKARVQLYPTKLRLERQSKGLSQEEVANKVGLTRPTYAAIETGARRVSEERAFKICEVIGLGRPFLFKSDRTKFIAKSA